MSQDLLRSFEPKSKTHCSTKIQPIKRARKYTSRVNVLNVHIRVAVKKNDSVCARLAIIRVRDGIAVAKPVLNFPLPKPR